MYGMIIENKVRVLLGTLVPNRHGSSASYRYGFNRMEKDDELKAEGNSYDFCTRMFDPRVGRWFARGSKESKYPNESTYFFVGNSPLIYVDKVEKTVKLTTYFQCKLTTSFGVN